MKTNLGEIPTTRRDHEEKASIVDKSRHPQLHCLLELLIHTFRLLAQPKLLKERRPRPGVLTSKVMVFVRVSAPFAGNRTPVANDM